MLWRWRVFSVDMLIGTATRRRAIFPEKWTLGCAVCEKVLPLKWPLLLVLFRELSECRDQMWCCCVCCSEASPREKDLNLGSIWHRVISLFYIILLILTKRFSSVETPPNELHINTCTHILRNRPKIEYFSVLLRYIILYIPDKKVYNFNLRCITWCFDMYVHFEMITTS